jgi:hypothetical protein
MAIKKNIDSQHYLYGVIYRMEYGKGKSLSFAFSIRKMNTSGEVLEIDTTQYFLPQAMECFSIEALSAEGNNPYKAVYEWLKANKPLYSDWEDC